MQLITSFFNKGIFINDLKRFSWIGILYTLSLFFAVPLHILMTYGQDDAGYTVMRELFYLEGGGLQGVLVLIVSIFTGILIFRYLQVEASSSMIHSLPIKRKILYRTHILVSLSLLILPVLLTAFISWILIGALDLGQYYGLEDIVKWAGFIILMELLIFFVCVFAGMIVGISVIQGVLTGIFLFLPLGLTFLLAEFMNIFIYGFAYNLNIDEEKLSPIIRLFEGFSRDTMKMGIGEIAIYIIVCLILYFLSEFLYNKRKLEAVSQTIAFHQFRWIFKYGVTICTMLMAGFYFNQTQQNTGWTLFGYILGSLIGYFVAEMVLKKSFWVFKNIKGYGIYAAVTMVILLGMHFDLMGYEKHLPSMDKVTSISFGNSFYQLKDGQNLYVDQENIKNIQRLHKQLIDDKSTNKYGDKKSTRYIVLVYHFEDGSRMTRGYSVDYDHYAQYLKPICESQEYKKFNYMALKVDASDVEKITIRPSLDANGEAIILNPEEIKEAINILRQDIEAETFEQMEDGKEPWANIRLLIADDKMKKYQRSYWEQDRREFYIPWKKSYGNFEAWLKQKDYLKNARVLPDEIDYVVVEKLDNPQQWAVKMKNGEWIDKTATKRLEITDKSQIETCLRNYSDVWRKNHEYIIGFYSEGNVNIGYGSFKKDNVPDFIKDKL